MVLPDSRNMPASEVKMLSFIAHLINSSRSSPRLILVDLMCVIISEQHWAPDFYCATWQTFLCYVSSLNGMLVPYVPLLVAVWSHPAGSLSQLTQQENKSIDYPCKDMVEAVRFLSFPCFRHVWKFMGFFLVLALYLNDLLYTGNLHGNLPTVVSSCCSRISLSSTVKALSIRL